MITRKIWDEIDPEDVVGKHSKNSVLLIKQLALRHALLWRSSDMSQHLLFWTQFRLDFMLVEAENILTETNVGTQ